MWYTRIDVSENLLCILNLHRQFLKHVRVYPDKTMIDTKKDNALSSYDYQLQLSDSF